MRGALEAAAAAASGWRSAVRRPHVLRRMFVHGEVFRLGSHVTSTKTSMVGRTGCRHPRRPVKYQRLCAAGSALVGGMVARATTRIWTAARRTSLSPPLKPRACCRAKRGLAALSVHPASCARRKRGRAVPWPVAAPRVVGALHGPPLVAVVRSGGERAERGSGRRIGARLSLTVTRASRVLSSEAGSGWWRSARTRLPVPDVSLATGVWRCPWTAPAFLGVLGGLILNIWRLSRSCRSAE